MTQKAAPAALPPAERRAAQARRWTEDLPRPPLDLRLLLAALALWLGAAAVLTWVPEVNVLALMFMAAAGITCGAMSISCGRGWVRVLALGGSCLMAGALLAGGTIVAARADPLVVAAPDRTTVTVNAGTVIDWPVTVPGFGGEPRYRVRLNVHSVTIDNELIPQSAAAITVWGTGAEWGGLSIGDRIAVRGVLATDDFPAIPAAQLRTRDPPELVDRAPGLLRATAGLRSAARDRAMAIGGDAGGLFVGIAVGDTSLLDPRLDADAKTTGLAHLLAVSGSHFTLLAGAVVLVLRRFGLRLAALAGILTTVGLVLLVGPQPSVLRAAAMGLIALAGLIGGRGRSALPILAGTVIVVLIVDPTLAVSPGFALSVMATGGLILLAPIWAEALQRRGWPKGWSFLLSIPAAATATTMPVIVAISGALSPASVPANIAVAPVIPPVLLLCVGAVLVGTVWPPVADVMVFLARPLLDWIAEVAHRLARIPEASISMPSTLPWTVGLVGVAAVCLAILRRQRWRALVGALVIGSAVVLIPARVVGLGWPPADVVVAGCEVGQGDAFVLPTNTPGAAVLIDAGPDPALLADCLDRLHITTIPLVVITHLHADHLDGLPGAFAGRSVGMVAVGPGREPFSAWQAVTGRADVRGVPVVQPAPGQSWESDGVQIEFLGPTREFRGTPSDPNNNSVVLRATRRGVRVMFTGDVELSAQSALLSSGVDLTAEVLKVPHHGSAKTLPAFVSAVRAQVALIGVGRGNDYGHPSATLLHILAGAGIGEVLRTDEDGDVAVVTHPERSGEVRVLTRGAVLDRGRG